ncbi:hypothetical protein [Sphingobium sp. B11D3B]|uniref:hypothetical protein n=1 Tax=Sphingobium sp. B11D3B TaxID=2940575 RepID=UPI002227D884|nr:hypothetical protein [Sphingobium sp. B11D3B]
MSASNQIAISHHVLVEAHKSNPQATLINSFERARAYPDQVLLMRDVIDVYPQRLDTGAKIRAMLIDRGQGPNFPIWYDDVVAAEQGSGMMTFLLNKQAQAKQVIANFAADAHHFDLAFRQMRKEFTPDELREIRARVIKSKSTQGKLIDAIYRISRTMFSRGQVANPPARYIDAPHYFLFRYAMCVVIFFIRWVKSGNLPQDTDKLVNHIVDLHIAAQATFFHGVLSRDDVVIDVHQQARFLLNMMGAHRFTMRKGTFVYG